MRLEIAVNRSVDAALDRLVVRHPELAKMRSAVTPGLRLTPDFVRHTRDPTVPYGRRSLVLRVLLGDATAGDCGTQGLDGAVLERLMDWLILSGAFEQGGTRETIPKAFATRMGYPRTDFQAFVARCCIAPWWEVLTDAPISVPALAALPRSELSPLKRAFDARHLSTRAAHDLCSSGSTRAARWWFDTGVPALDLRNALVFLSVLLDGPREAGRVQNRIPVALSARWGLRRLSIPDAIAFADVASLALTGALVLERVSNDWTGLAAALASDQARQFVKGDDDAAAAVAAHVDRWILPRNGASAIVERAKIGETGTFDTGFLFNSFRLSGRAPIVRFAPYYNAVNGAAIGDMAVRRWGLPDARGVIRVAKSLRPGGEIAVRDFGNLIVFLEQMRAFDEASAWKALPPVARFALGAQEPRPTATRVNGPRTGESTPRTGALRDLDQMWRHYGLRVAHLLRLGAAVPVTTDPIFVARADASGRTLPPGVALVGTAPVAWDADVEAEAIAELEREGYSVVVHGPS
jgi:hypothetical protein